MRLILPEGKRGRGRPKSDFSGDSELMWTSGTKEEQIAQLIQGDATHKTWVNCDRCEMLCAHRRNVSGRIVFGEGNLNSGIMIIGEAPGEDEERTGSPFTGQSGQLLNRLMARTTLDLDVRHLTAEYEKTRKTLAVEKAYTEQIIAWRQSNFFVTNVVACRPPENRTPTLEETRSCWQRLWQLIYIVDPFLVIVTGNTPMSVVSQLRGLKITQKRGDLHDFELKGHFAYVKKAMMPVFHPSYLLRRQDQLEAGGDYKKSEADWYQAMHVVAWMKHVHRGAPLPPTFYEK